MEDEGRLPSSHKPPQYTSEGSDSESFQSYRSCTNEGANDENNANVPNWSKERSPASGASVPDEEYDAIVSDEEETAPDPAV